ncbi:MAG: Gfo/Idh/MocA family oxidoreductase [Candidatus Hydrogenedentes bacterium]|nr:Gfo/Idh/MocA family oxidoreductase [Candidatus Hydrogenedentota bacterium]
MFRLGIIGSDNSHAEAFARLANVETGPQKIEGVQVSCIYGTDPARTKEVAEKGKIPTIVSNTEEMLGQVDGVLCVWRHGDKHLPDTMPFIKAGIPAFVDKPLACKVADARQLIDAALEHKVGFTSFSTLRYEPGTAEFIKTMADTGGGLTAATVSGPAQLDSEYGGIFFYGIHSVELMNAVLGYGCKTVYATSANGNCAVTCTFGDDRIATLNLLGNAKVDFHILAFGKNAWNDHRIDAGNAYAAGMKVFVETLQTGKWPLTPEQLLEPIQILAAIQKSLAEKRAVGIEEV